MDEVRIWNDVRTATEISQNYKGVLTGSEANLVAYYKFDDNLNDSSGNNLHLTGVGDIGTYSSATVAAGDPLVFDLDGDGVELLGLDAGVTFDLFGSPERENTGWVGPSDGLLAMDLDGSGAIENLTEIFSDRFGGVSFPSSLDALRSLDTNADGMIDNSDPSFGDILLWQDINSDGLSSEEELRTLIDHGIVAIDLDADENSELVMGNRIDATGRFQFLDGSSGTYSQVRFVVSESDVSNQEISHISSSAENNANEPADVNVEMVSIPEELENLVLAGSSALNGVGNSHANDITGNSGNNNLSGLAGNDTLDGGPGIDTLTGGSGDDVFHYDSTFDGASASDGQSGLQTGDQITDFTSGTDQFQFSNSAFGFGSSKGSFTAGTNFFTKDNYDGTNSGATSGAHFVFDSGSRTLYHDDDPSQDGYTVVATVQSGASVSASDIGLVIS